MERQLIPFFSLDSHGGYIDRDRESCFGWYKRGAAIDIEKIDTRLVPQALEARSTQAGR